MKTLIKTVSKFIVLFTAVLIFTSDSLQAQCGWERVYNDTLAGFGSGGIFFTSANTGYAVGSKRIGDNQFPDVIKTTDAGNNWFALTTPLSDSAFMYFRYVFFTDANTGFITSAQNLNPVTANGKILKTTNAGNTWTVYTPSVNKHMTCIWFVNSTTGFATGYKTILKTTDAGGNWSEVFVPNMNGYLFGIYFTSVNTGYVAGNLGYILKTTDCGAIWTPQNSNYSTSLWSVWFTDANTGIVVGGHSNNVGNKIFRTTDAGNSWDSVQHQPSNAFLFSVRFVNSATGFITGDYAQVFKTTNSGLNWYRQYLPVSDSIGYFATGTFFTSPNTGYLAGMYLPFQGRQIYKTTTGGDPIGIKPISNEIPERFSLSQNFPNPFNPVTKITFALPKSGDVKLTLYDVLGREIAVLVNEKLSHGTYEVDFDGTNYPSGVYLYTLRTDDFVDTKKMILVK